MTHERYNPQAIEEKWQARWQAENAFACSDKSDKPKYYVLEMFPYPSGNIHMGHVRNYAIGDVVARTRRMLGYNVLHPMGWDAFGLPAENAAIKHHTHPARWTYDNIANMRAQLQRLGYSYDWSREVATCRPEYYRWEQMFFLRLLEKGLVYRKKAAQNWCPSCHTVLANEQVIDGLCWRCDSRVIQKDLTQWFLKITAYGDELLEDLQKLEGGWPERVLAMQRNWIGKSTGAAVTFALEKPVEGAQSLDVFTTRPDTLFGVTFMTLAPEHPLVEQLIAGQPQADQVRAFVERIRNMDRLDRQSENLEKEGIFTGAYALHPFTGQRVPLWLGNFVLADYGTGAVMGVPAHDQRDFEFARKYGLPVKVVICPKGEELRAEELAEAFTAEGVMVGSGPFDGLPNVQGRRGRSLGKRRQRPRHYPVSPAGLEHLAPALLGRTHPRDLLRKMRRGAGKGRKPARAPAHGRQNPRGRPFPPAGDPGFCPMRLPALRRPGPARNRHSGHLCGVFLVFRPLHQRPQYPGPL